MDRNSKLDPKGRGPTTMSTGAGRAAVIRVSPLEGRNEGLQRFIRALPAVIISFVMHTALLALFLFITLEPAQAAPDASQDVIESKVEEQMKDADLTNTEIGLDPDVPTNYDVKRIEEFSVPGPVD